MPDDRLFHKRLGHSDKINKLTDFEDRVWRAYVLSADDFGVMRFSAITLQADHDYCARRPQKTVQKALEIVHNAGLIVTFEHQHRIYCAQQDWQKHQKIKHPRQTINPKPDDVLMRTFEAMTQELFLYWPGKKREKFDEHSGNVSETFGHLARARPRETAHTNANGSSSEGEGGVGETHPERAGAFCQWYADAHERLVHVGYIGNPRRDYEKALELVARFSDDELRDAATVWFGQDDKFATDGTRTIPKFGSRASDLVLRARRVSA